MSIKENLEKIKEQTSNVNVKIIAVTKYATEEQIISAYESGMHDFGESYVQKALEKLSLKFKDSENLVNWHFIGRLQKNKVKHAAGNFYLIHSVDSLELAEVISKTAGKKRLTQNILLQVNIFQDPSKAGFTEDKLKSTFENLIKLPDVKVLGLMTIAPKTNDMNLIKSNFLKLVNLKEELNQTYKTNLKELSMGMSNDYKIAIECGSTMIRIGRAIFSEFGG
ncbi:MAG: YggS family pyridoxal phosphate-dependent enzyme [Candidatus Melainabacteria bacterium]|nr:YggS family pyridoxal phosphate-dependent enzyme [Candidatus Melainabacteria bacterium]